MMNDYEALLPSDIATSLSVLYEYIYAIGSTAYEYWDSNDLERAAKALNHIKDVLISKEDELDEHEN